MSEPWMNDCYQQKISVPFEYPVHFVEGVFEPENELLLDVLKPQDRPARVLVCLDQGLADAQPGLQGRIVAWFAAHENTDLLTCLLQPGGEKGKAAKEPAEALIAALAEVHLDRQSYVLAIGGGAMLDMVGWAVSMVHRGLRIIRMPSTTLAQDDAGIGVKNGIDAFGQKNFLGTFAPPWAVINDFSLLHTLDEEQWLSGIAEAIKVALIRDADFFDWICVNTKALRARDAAAMQYLIKRCAWLHLEHIRTSGDPFEFGAARPLDFGHWAAHRIENLSGYNVGHGFAVAAGVALDALIALERRLLPGDSAARILVVLENAGLPCWFDEMAWVDADGELELWVGLEQFREHLGGKLCITLPQGLGKGLEVHELKRTEVRAAVNMLSYKAGRGGLK